MMLTMCHSLMEKEDYMRVDEIIFRNYNNLNETDVMIWRFVNENKESCGQMSIDTLASHCNVSRTTITRFVKKIGFRGYSEFKVVLNWESKETIDLDEKAYDLSCNAIVKYVEDQRDKNYDDVCKLIYEAHQVFVYGTGDIQNAVAKQMKRMFLSAQEAVYDFGSITFDNAFYHLVQSNDVIFLISLSGDSEEVLQIAERLKLNGVKIISITEFRDNRLTQLADESLYISATSLSILQSHPAYKTTMLYFILVELLFIKYSIYKKNRMILEGIKGEL